MTLSKSDVMKMQPACVCACIAVSSAWSKMDQRQISQKTDNEMARNTQCIERNKTFISFHKLRAERML